MYDHISLRIWTPFPLRSPPPESQREREREEETLSLFALKQRARGKEREERSMISFDSVQWRARARALSTLSGVHIFHCNRCLWSESCARHYGERPRCELKGIGVGTAAHRSIPPRRVTRKSSRSAMPCHGYDSLNTRRRGQSEDDAGNNEQWAENEGERGKQDGIFAQTPPFHSDSDMMLHILLPFARDE